MAPLPDQTDNLAGQDAAIKAALGLVFEDVNMSRTTSVEGSAKPEQQEASLDSMLHMLRVTFSSNKTKDLAWRTDQLLTLRRALVELQDDIVEALISDSGRPYHEVFAAELSALVLELDVALEQLPLWMKPQEVNHPLMAKPGKSAILHVPKGVVLIIGPWSLPLGYCLIPAIAALASGNCIVVKPSEFAPKSALVLEKILGHLDQTAVQLLQGSISETKLLKLRFDHIMYSGTSEAAKVVMHSAAEHLTPVTLQLGGKNPVIIDESVNLKTIGNRVLWGKFCNCGQNGSATDYALVTEGIRDQVVSVFKETLLKFYGQDPHVSPYFGRIVNEDHWDRLQGLLKGHGGKSWVAEGGKPAMRSERFMPPTLIEDPDHASRLMQEEILGPILPIITVKCVDDAIDFVNARERPLTLYIFSESEDAVNKVLGSTISGSVCVNDTLMHRANPSLPFGGVGASGIGAFNGRSGFEEFSHSRSVMWRPTWFDPLQRYPPYADDCAAFRCVHCSFSAVLRESAGGPKGWCRICTKMSGITH